MIKGKYGFTLAELMAVVVIVGIIAAAALGSYRSAAQRSLFAEGTAGMHAIASAIDTYYEDYRSFPSDLSQTVLQMNKATISGTTVTSRNFTYTYDSTAGSVCAARIGGFYTLCTYLENGSNRTKKDKCTAADESLCKDMGYTSGVDSTWFQKP